MNSFSLKFPNLICTTLGGEPSNTCFKLKNESMNNEVKFYLGMDVSKLWIDICVMCVLNHEKQPIVTNRFDNDAAGMKNLLTGLTASR